MSEAEEQMIERLQRIPLLKRLSQAEIMIAKMCKDSRPPAMTIPVQWDDEDQYIIQTLKDVAAYVKGQNFRDNIAIAALQGMLHNSECTPDNAMLATTCYEVADAMLEARKK